jgi:hypothetical protein
MPNPAEEKPSSASVPPSRPQTRHQANVLGLGKAMEELAEHAVAIECHRAVTRRLGPPFSANLKETTPPPRFQKLGVKPRLRPNPGASSECLGRVPSARRNRQQLAARNVVLPITVFLMDRSSVSASLLGLIQRWWSRCWQRVLWCGRKHKHDL